MEPQQPDSRERTLTSTSGQPASSAEASARGLARPTWVLLPEEARARGFRNALAFKRWCVRHHVAIRRDARMLWVRPLDVDVAVGGLPIRSTTPAVAASVDAIKARHR